MWQLEIPVLLARADSVLPGPCVFWLAMYVGSIFIMAKEHQKESSLSYFLAYFILHFHHHLPTPTCIAMMSAFLAHWWLQKGIVDIHFAVTVVIAGSLHIKKILPLRK
jgi:hypothetical protein